jgi:hypothetical protein
MSKSCESQLAETVHWLKGSLRSFLSYTPGVRQIISSTAHPPIDDRRPMPDICCPEKVAWMLEGTINSFTVLSADSDPETPSEYIRKK